MVWRGGMEGGERGEGLWGRYVYGLDRYLPYLRTYLPASCSSHINIHIASVNTPLSSLMHHIIASSTIKMFVSRYR